jgi:uncharacterized phage protein (TIGR02218 family)
MLAIPTALQDRLDAGVTTLVWCWRVTRRDGQVFGFTDHDQSLAFDGLTFRPDSGFTGSDLDARLGGEAAASEIAGLFDDDAISNGELAAGLWDGAKVEVFRVDWRDVSMRVQTWTGELGSVTHDGSAFRADLNGFSRRLERAIGRIYSRHCDAEFGDARCGLDYSQPAFKGAGTVSAILPNGISATGLSGFADTWFEAGFLIWTSGAAAGARQRVSWHRLNGAEAHIGVAENGAVEIGQTFDIVAGCDKQHATCRDKFANIINFRGFALMPGNDVLIAGPASEPVRDGGSRGLA